jgi:hypothetical protein
MNEDRNHEPGERLKTILSTDQDDEIVPLKSLSPSQAQSPLDKLPRLKSTEQTNSQVPAKKVASNPEVQAPLAELSILPQSKQVEQPAEPPAPQSTGVQDVPRREKFLRALWTLTSLISMVVNVVVIIVLIVLLWAYRDIQLPEGVDTTMVNKLLNGLYSNFEKMDRATIETVIPVDAQIPLNITVPVQTTTQITLSETVNIPNAQVVINTGGLNINSSARVTLPAGTPLTINLNFDLPVQDTIPVHLDVPVKIPMAETELHEPFVGLQDVVRPLYCLVEPNATGLDAQLVCR